MRSIGYSFAVSIMAFALTGTTGASADPFSFSTGEPDGHGIQAGEPPEDRNRVGR